MSFSHAFVTGASSGIGRSLSLELARAGTHVIVSARREPELLELAQTIRRAGGRADICVLDVADPTAVQQAIKAWDEQCGGLDLVVANAGTGVIRPAHKLSWDDDILPVLQVNVVGAFATITAGMQAMLTRGKGTLVGVSSLAAVRGFPMSGAYPASKAALATFLETLRIELSPRGIRVVDVRPGFVDTAMTRSNTKPMPFLMQVDDAAAVALRGIARGDAIVSFPWAMRAALSLVEVAPDHVYRAIAARVRY